MTNFPIESRSFVPLPLLQKTAEETTIVTETEQTDLATNEDMDSSCHSTLTTPSLHSNGSFSSSSSLGDFILASPKQEGREHAGEQPSKQSDLKQHNLLPPQSLDGLTRQEQQQQQQQQTTPSTPSTHKSSASMLDEGACTGADVDVDVDAASPTTPRFTRGVRGRRHSTYGSTTAMRQVVKQNGLGGEEDEWVLFLLSDEAKELDNDLNDVLPSSDKGKIDSPPPKPLRRSRPPTKTASTGAIRPQRKGSLTFATSIGHLKRAGTAGRSTSVGDISSKPLRRAHERFSSNF